MALHPLPHPRTLEELPQAIQPSLPAIGIISHLQWGAFLSPGPEIPTSCPVGLWDCRWRGEAYFSFAQISSAHIL